MEKKAIAFNNLIGELLSSEGFVLKMTMWWDCLFKFHFLLLLKHAGTET